MTWVLILLPPLLLLVAAWSVARRFEARVAVDAERVRSAPAPPGKTPGPPPLLRAYLERTGIPLDAPARWFEIEQEGEMRLRPGADWQAFHAVQTFAVAEPAFVWKARFRMFRVVDCLVAGAGRLEARLLGVVPVARSSGPDATAAQLLRYLAEIVWAPAAIAANPALSWEQTEDRTVIGRADHAAVGGELRFIFDAAGDIVEVRGERARSTREGLVQTPWSGRFADHRVVGGVRIPTRAEVEWMLEDGAFVYWRATVNRLRTGS